MTLDYDTLLDALYDADLDEDAIRSNYSGRGMFGDACLGITFESIGQLMQLAAVLGTDYANLFRGARTDSMGMHMIVYFPGVTLTGDPAEA